MRILLMLALSCAAPISGAPAPGAGQVKASPRQELGRLLLGGDIYRALEEMLARELPKRVAPADRWDVKIARDGNDLGAGKFSRVEVHGVNVRAPGGLLLSDATVTFDDLEIDMASGAVRVLGDSRFTGRLSEAALAQLLTGRPVKGWKNLRVTFRHSKLAVSGDAELRRGKLFGREIPFPAVPVAVVGEPLPRGTAIDFKADSLSLERLPVPGMFVHALERRLNPVVNLSGLNAIERITRVAVDGNYLVTEAQLDFSKGLPGTANKNWGVADAARAAPLPGR